LNNQRGQITMDFIFAIVLVLGFTALLFCLTFTLSVASITQYITFAAARNFTAAHLTQADQIKQANAKYSELIANPVFKVLYSNGWFKVDAQPSVGDQTTYVPGYQAAAGGANEFWGVGTHFSAPILAFRVPFFGSTVSDGSGGSGFTTYMGSYLGREPSTDECLKFVAQRWTYIRQMAVSGGAAYSTAPDGPTTVMDDNGC
jgi:hypothetical protein